MTGENNTPSSDGSILAQLQNDEASTSHPRLKHTLQLEDTTVLSLLAHGSYIYSGSQNQDIYVWNRKDFKQKTTLKGHSGSVLALEVAPEQDWLFSSSGDSTIRVWCTNSLAALYKISPYLENDTGDLFCLAYSPQLKTLYVGCQNASVQWIDFTKVDGNAPPPVLSHEFENRRFHKFFDSFPQHERRAPGQDVPEFTSADRLTVDTTQELHINSANVVNYAHLGYVYCMTLHAGKSDSNSNNKDLTLVTGSGDESVKIWGCTGGRLDLIATLDGSDGAILSIVARDGAIYAGCQGGRVKVWDIDTRTLVRNILAQEGHDIMSLSMLNGILYTCSSSGMLQAWSSAFACDSTWQGHDGIVLSSITDADPDIHQRCLLLTGGNDGKIKVWNVNAASYLVGDVEHNLWHAEPDTLNDGRSLVDSLADFVALRSISSEPHREECRETAIWLKKHLSQLGADSAVLPAESNVNPIVLATFNGKDVKGKRRILFYGHYDVVFANNRGWISSPFKLSGRNGFLYGRGVTDNKGPILAFAHAASNLLTKQALNLDLIMLIEGEEEAGSKGFDDAVRAHKKQIGHVDAIIISNSYWIGEDTPCITYGLRGVVHASVEIHSLEPDLHSGVEGGASPEAMQEMIQLLSMLTDRNRVLMEGFYDSVRTMTDPERELYALLEGRTERSASSMITRWREPSLTIHSIDVSGPRNSTVIPATVKAQISLRIVPDQDLDQVKRQLIEHVQKTFSSLCSRHKLRTSIDRVADWWLGDLEGPWFQALESAVETVWGERPLCIREGGSIPSLPMLEKEFGCHALHLPMGQSSDQAHLQNERISLSNLIKGKAVVETFFRSVGSWQL